MLVRTTRCSSLLSPRCKSNEEQESDKCGQGNDRPGGTQNPSREGERRAAVRPQDSPPAGTEDLCGRAPGELNRTENEAKSRTREADIHGLGMRRYRM